MRVMVGHVSWVLIGNIIYSATQFFILALIAKVGGPYDVGLFTLALAICTPIFMFLNVKLRTVVLTDHDNESTYSEYYYLRMYTNLMALAIIIFILIVFDLGVEGKVAIFILAIAKSIEMKIDLHYGYYQKNKKYNIVGISNILRGVLNLMFCLISYTLFKDILYIMLSYLISNIIVYYFYDKKNIKGLSYRLEKIDNQKIKILFLTALPLGLSTLLGSLNTNIPRYIIEYQLGLYELGIFAGITYLLVIGNTFLSAISPVVTPMFAKFVSEHKYKEFKMLLYRLVLFGFILGLSIVSLFIFLGSEILTIVYTTEYAQYHDVLIIIGIGLLFLYTSIFLGTAITSLKAFKVQPIINGIGLLTTTLLGLFLINQYGLVGMAYALTINYIVVSLGYVIALFKILNKRMMVK